MKNRKISLDKIDAPTCLKVNGKYSDPMDYSYPSDLYNYGNNVQFIFPIVKTSYYFGKKANFIYKMIWKAIKPVFNFFIRKSEYFSMESGISDCHWSIVKYLVEERGFGLSDALTVAPNLCERCVNICLYELNGDDFETATDKTSTSRTYCDNCNLIDPKYARKYRARSIYRGLFSKKLCMGSNSASEVQDLSMEEKISEFKRKNGRYI